MANRMIEHFKIDESSPGRKVVTARCFELAVSIDSLLPEGPEKTAGLRKLLEARDCFARAVVDTDSAPKTDVQKAAEAGFRS